MATVLPPETERVTDYGVTEEGVPWVVTEKGTGNNVPRNKYVGNEIPAQFIQDVKSQQEEKSAEKVDTTDFDKFVGAIDYKGTKNPFQVDADSLVDNPREEYTKGFSPPNIDNAKIQKGQEQLDEYDNLNPERFPNQAEDVQINASDTYQEVKPPESGVEEVKSPWDNSGLAIDSVTKK